jgi:hypothetical protein
MDHTILLNMLNTASREHLLHLPGFGPTIADLLITARPFETLEDATKVRGLTLQKLEYISDHVPNPEEPPVETAIMATPDDSLSKVGAPKMDTPKTEPPKRKGISFGRIFGFIFRLILTLAILAGVAAAIYFGTPYVYQQYIQPVKNNTARLSALEKQQAADIAQATGQIAELEARIAQLEGSMQTVEAAIQTHTDELVRLNQLEADLKALTEMVDAQVVSPDSPFAEAQRQIAQLKILTLLSRSRLFLSQSNFGSARQDVSAARDLLAALQPTLPDYQQPAGQAILTRLDLALGNLPDFPVIAVGDVDIAWQLMLMGFPTEAQADAVTPTTTLVPEITPMTPFPTSTPTPLPIDTATPTP